MRVVILLKIAHYNFVKELQSYAVLTAGGVRAAGRLEMEPYENLCSATGRYD